MGHIGDLEQEEEPKFLDLIGNEIREDLQGACPDEIGGRPCNLLVISSMGPLGAWRCSLCFFGGVVSTEACESRGRHKGRRALQYGRVRVSGVMDVDQTLSLPPDAADGREAKVGRGLKAQDLPLRRLQPVPVRPDRDADFLVGKSLRYSLKYSNSQHASIEYLNPMGP